MRKVLYLDCSSGISGDMLLSSMLGMADEKVLRKELEKLGLGDEFQLKVTEVVRVCTAKSVEVITSHHDHDHHEHNHNHEHEHSHEHEHHNHNHDHHDNHDHEHSHEYNHNEHACASSTSHTHHYHNHGRTYADIVDIISSSTLDDKTKELALQIFETLAVAEAQAHAVEKAEVHFHEVGAIDSIVDIVGFSILYNLLEVSCVEINSINLGSGTVRCQHGVLAVPVPAVINMLQGFTVHAKGEFERATPTGIAILKTVGAKYVSGACGKVLATGCGAGTHYSESDNNTLNSYLLEQTDVGNSTCGADVVNSISCAEKNAAEVNSAQSSQPSNTTIVIATNIDNSTGEQLGFLAQILLEQGALDVWFSPIFMKKFRPAYKLEVICYLAAKDKFVDIIFKHSGTIGVRITAVDRIILPRSSETAMTSYGEVSIKACGEGKTSRIGQDRKFEYDSLVMVARQCNCSLAEAQAKLEKELYD